MIYKEKLTVHIRVPLRETEVLERARRYFSESGYHELYDESPALKFRRFTKPKNLPASLLKSVLTDGIAGDMDPNSRYSLVKLILKPKNDGVSIQATFEDMSLPYQFFFIQEVLQKEITAFKTALIDNTIRPVSMPHARRRYVISYLISIGLVILSSALFVGLSMLFFSLLKSYLNPAVILLMTAVIVAGLVILSFRRRKMAIERKGNYPKA